MASVEQLLRQHCPLISEEFLPDLLSKLRQNDVCTSMLLACELTDQDLQDIGVTQLGVRRKFLKVFGARSESPELASSQPGVPAAAATASRQQSASQPAAPRQTSAAAQPEVKPQPRRRAVVAPAPQPKSLPLGGWALGQGPRDQRQTPVPDLSLHYGKPAYPPAQRSLPQPSSQPAVLTPPPQPPQAAPAPACPASSTSISSAEDAPMQRKRRTARSLSEKEKKKMTEQRRQEMRAIATQEGWMGTMWKDITRAGSAHSKKLSKMVAQLARKYPGIDGKNRTEREAILIDKFKNLVHDSRRKSGGGGAAAAAGRAAPAAAATPAAVAPDGTGLPLMTRLGPSDVLRVTSEPLSPNGIAKMAARRAELRAMAEQQGGRGRGR